MYKEIFIVLCLSAVLMVQAYPSENIESQDLQAAGQVELEPSNADDSDLEGAESRYGGGWSRRSGGWGGRGHGGYGGGWNRGYGGYRNYGYGGYNRGYGGGWNRGWNYYG